MAKNPEFSISALDTATLENISADHLCQVLEEVEESATSERLMAAITYKEFDDVTPEDAAELYGYSEGWASKWFNRLERLHFEPFEAVVYDESREGRPTELSSKSIKNSSTHSMSRPKKSE